MEHKGLNQTPSAERIHISFFGRTNSGKSTLINTITNQSISIVSEIKGTTTDPVSKSMELFPLGPVILTDTPGLDDDSALGKMRIEKTFQILNKTDIAILVVDVTVGIDETERTILDEIKRRKISYLVVINKTDLVSEEDVQSITKAFKEETAISVSAKTGENIEYLIKTISVFFKEKDKKKQLVCDLVERGDYVILVIPIDESAPKGRLILPQQQTIRDLLEANAICMVTQVSELEKTLKLAAEKPKLVITDSQAFQEVSKIVPEDIYLTSFSILFARYKGNLDSLMESASQIEQLEDGDRILISEGCTHHRQCNDIGSVKIPKWLESYTKKKFDFSYTSGGGFPQDLSSFQMIIHCGGCMLNEKEMNFRIAEAKRQNVPILNYGMFISYINGILERATRIFKPLCQTYESQ